MTSKIVLTGASGKIGGAVLEVLLDYNLMSPSDLVIATSSKADHPKLVRAASLGATIRQSNYDSIELMTEAFAGCERLFLVSSSHINLDFHDCAKGGREKHHFNALEAAKRAGVSHVYYTSLAFQDPSKAGVMRAHLKTEEFLRSQKDFSFTVLREGLYNESWPLYLGHFKVPEDERSTIVLGPDGPISWTSIPDLGLANALIVVANRQEWTGKTLWLSQKRTLTVTDVASIVGRVHGKALSVDSRSPQEYIRHYTKDRGMDEGLIAWWSSTYPALKDNECKIEDSPFEELLASKSRKPKTMEQTISEMLRT